MARRKDSIKSRHNQLSEHFVIKPTTRSVSRPKLPRRSTSASFSSLSSEDASSPPRRSSLKQQQREQAQEQVQEQKQQQRRRRSSIKFRPRRPWTLAEVDALKLGIAKYGIGNWTAIARDSALQFDRRSSNDVKDKYRTLKEARYGSNMTNNIFKVGFKILAIVDMTHDLVLDEPIPVFSIMTNLHSGPILWVREQSQHPDWLPALRAYREKGQLSKENIATVNRLLTMNRPYWSMNPIFVRESSESALSAEPAKKRKASPKKIQRSTKESPTPTHRSTVLPGSKEQSCLEDAKIKNTSRTVSSDYEEADEDDPDSPRLSSQKAAVARASPLADDRPSPVRSAHVKQNRLAARKKLLEEQEQARQRLEEEREARDRQILATKQEALAAAQADLDRFNEMRARHSEMSEVARRQIESESLGRKRERIEAPDVSLAKPSKRGAAANVAKLSDAEDESEMNEREQAMEEQEMHFEELPRKSASARRSGAEPANVACEPSQRQADSDLFEDGADFPRADEHAGHVGVVKSLARISQSQDAAVPLLSQDTESVVGHRISQSQPVHLESSLVDSRSRNITSVSPRKAPTSPRRIALAVDETARQQFELAKKRDKILQHVRRSRELARSDADVSNLSQSEPQCTLM